MSVCSKRRSLVGRLRTITGEDVLARRDREVSDWGSQRLCSEKWLKEGKVEGSDLFPWLRGVQRMGYELTIIGSSVDALRVCLEAWRAGFKPVMILMEDQLQDNDDGDEVKELMNGMMSYLGDRGLFRHGPAFIYSDSHKCKVQLDGWGRVTDVLVLTNLAGLNTHSESWQLFKGPAIVVDVFTMTDMREMDNGMESLEEVALKAEDANLLDVEATSKQQDANLLDVEATCKQQDANLLDVEATCKQQDANLLDVEATCKQQMTAKSASSLLSTQTKSIMKSEMSIGSKKKKKVKVQTSEDHIEEIAQEALDDVGEIAVEPFKPPGPLVSHSDLRATRGKLGKGNHHQVPQQQVPQVILPPEADESATQAFPPEANDRVDRVESSDTVPVIKVDTMWSLFGNPTGARATKMDSSPTATLSRERSFVAMARKERASIISPDFWEERTDADSRPFTTVSPETIAPLCLSCIIQSFLYCFQYNFLQSSYFGVWRVVFKFLPEFLSVVAVVNQYLISLGLDVPTRRPCKASLAFGIIYYALAIVPQQLQLGGFWVTDFANCSICLCLVVPLLPIYAHFRGKRQERGQRLTKLQFAWFCAAVVGTFGFYVVAGAIIVAYLMLMTWDSSAAGIFLTVAFGLGESGFVVMMLALYNMLVYYPRRKNPNAVIGDQKSVLSFCIIVTHACTECGRMVALTCGSARATGLEHLRSVAVTCASGLVINVAGRTFWTVCSTAKLLGQKRQWWVEWLCPTFITALHMDCKFTMGWPRFFVFLGCTLARGAMRGDFNTAWFPEEPNFWCWNGVALMAVLLCWVSELIEDWCVFIVNGKMPAPIWRFFGDVMLKQFQEPKQNELMHTSHFLVPANILPDPRSRGEHAFLVDKFIAYSSAPRAKTTKLSKCTSMVGSRLSDLAPQLTASPNFRHCRKATIWTVFGATGACVALTSLGFQVGLGFGYYAGLCWPNELQAGMLLVLREMILFRPDCVDAGKAAPWAQP